MLVLILIFQKNKTPDPTWDWWYLVAKQMSNVSSASAGCSSCNYHWCSHSSWVQLQSSWCKQDAQKRSTLSTVPEMVIMFVVFETYVYGGVDCEMQIFGQFISRKVHSWIIKDLFSVIIPALASHLLEMWEFCPRNPFWPKIANTTSKFNGKAVDA